MIGKEQHKLIRVMVDGTFKNISGTNVPRMLE
jgi:hypothetical protein